MNNWPAAIVLGLLLAGGIVAVASVMWLFLTETFG